jgi:hypothetical protein
MGRGLGVFISYSYTLILYSTSIFYDDLFCLFLIIYLLVGYHEKPLTNQPVAKGHLWEAQFRLVWRISMNERMNKGRKEGREGRKEGINLKQHIC